MPDAAHTGYATDHVSPARRVRQISPDIGSRQILKLARRCVRNQFVNAGAFFKNERQVLDPRSLLVGLFLPLDRLRYMRFSGRSDAPAKPIKDAS